MVFVSTKKKKRKEKEKAGKNFEVRKDVLKILGGGQFSVKQQQQKTITLQRGLSNIYALLTMCEVMQDGWILAKFFDCAGCVRLCL